MHEFWSRNSSSKAQKRIAKIAKLVGDDFRAMNILFNANWSFDSPRGWIGTQDGTPAAELEFAEKSGLIPAAFQVTPQEVIHRIVQALGNINKEKVANAFVTGLATGRPDFSSILGTYACFYGENERSLLAKLESEHGIEGLKSDGATMLVKPHRAIFTRFFRANAMEHDNAIDALLEFEAFVKIEVKTPSDDAVQLLRAIRPRMNGGSSLFEAVFLPLRRA